MKIINCLHRRIFGYPSRGHVRKALELNKANTSTKWRTGMLYVCGENIDQIAGHLGCTRERVRQILCVLVRGVE